MSVEEENTFELADYDCVGFDLDNTLCEYRIGPMVQMIYDVLADYLLDKCTGYSAERLRQPVDFEFLQRGLILDTERGNVLKLNGEGRVLRAAHGTRFMSDDEIASAYGPDRRWSVADTFVRDFSATWNGPLAQKIRPLLDFFDVPVSLVFGRCVDDVDDRGAPAPGVAYTVWPDVMDGLAYMYSRENFAANAGRFFPLLKADPSRYYNKCPEYVLRWLERLKRTKKVFLVSGSHVDYANFSATQSLGADWKRLFDVVVFYARKPGFFNADKPFYATDAKMANECGFADKLSFDNVYSQGNWNQLFDLFIRETGKPNPKCLYIGDNILQDVIAPAKFSGLDTLAVIEEMKMDCNDVSLNGNPDNFMLRTNKWSSYLVDSDKKDTSIWTSFIANYSKLCVPSLKCLADKNFNHKHTPFSKNKLLQGFFPFLPNSLYKIIKH